MCTGVLKHVLTGLRQSLSWPSMPAHHSALHNAACVALHLQCLVGQMLMLHVPAALHVYDRQNMA